MINCWLNKVHLIPRSPSFSFRFQRSRRILWTSTTRRECIRRHTCCARLFVLSISVDLYPTKIATSLAGGAREAGAGRAMRCLETQLISINKAQPAFAALPSNRLRSHESRRMNATTNLARCAFICSSLR